MEKRPPREPLLTQAIIDLHEKGYCEDFIPIEGDLFFCTGSRSQFFRSQLTMGVYKNALPKASKKALCYLESCDGIRGIMLVQLV